MSTTILFIDSCADDVTLARWHLTRAELSAETLHAQSRAELSALLARSTIDLIVSDFHLQFWDGLEILETARSLASTVPFIFYSGLLLPAQVTLALQRGAYGCANKGDPDAFVRLVKSALEPVGTRTRS